MPIPREPRKVDGQMLLSSTGLRRHQPQMQEHIDLLLVVVVVVLLGNPTGLSWPNNRDSEIFLQLLPESVQRRS